MCLHSPKPICAEQLLQSLDWPYLSHRLRAQKQGILLFILRALAQSRPLINVCGMDVRRKEGSKLPAALLATAVSVSLFQPHLRHYVFS